MIMIHDHHYFNYGELIHFQAFGKRECIEDIKSELEKDFTKLFFNRIILAYRYTPNTKKQNMMFLKNIIKTVFPK